jgi:hypothetical protein
MAQVTNGMGLGLAGKVGDLVYVPFNGGTYTRKAPRRKKDSSTPRMLLNQQRFRQVNDFCAQFKYSVIPQIWNAAALNNFSKVFNFGKVELVEKDYFLLLVRPTFTFSVSVVPGRSSASLSATNRPVSASRTLFDILAIIDIE